MRWRDRVRKDLRKFSIEESGWFQLVQDRSGWRGCCRAGLEDVTRARVEEDEARRLAHVEGSTGGSESVAAA